MKVGRPFGPGRPLGGGRQGRHGYKHRFSSHFSYHGAMRDSSPSTESAKSDHSPAPGAAASGQLDGPGDQDRDRTPPPLSRGTRKWVQRAEVDRRSRARLRVIEGDGVIVLNDRRDPGSDTSFKLIAVSSSGVFVIDAKDFRGLVHTKRTGPMVNLGPRELHVGKKNCMASVVEVSRQRAIVQEALATSAWGSEVPVHGMLCLTRAEWGFASALQISEVWVGWPKLMAGRVQAPGVMDSPTVREVSDLIAEQLPVA
jgi:hypothetical protein